MKGCWESKVNEKPDWEGHFEELCCILTLSLPLFSIYVYILKISTLGYIQDGVHAQLSCVFAILFYFKSDHNLQNQRSRCIKEKLKGAAECMNSSGKILFRL